MNWRFIYTKMAYAITRKHLTKRRVRVYRTGIFSPRTTEANLQTRRCSLRDCWPT